MADEGKTKLRLEIAHVLSMDIVGHSKLLIDEAIRALDEQNRIVRNTEAGAQRNRRDSSSASRKGMDGAGLHRFAGRSGLRTIWQERSHC